MLPGNLHPGRHRLPDRRRSDLAAGGRRPEGGAFINPNRDMPPALTLSFRTQVQALDPEKEFSFLGETACAITEIAERCEDRNVCVRE